MAGDHAQMLEVTWGLPFGDLHRAVAVSWPEICNLECETIYVMSVDCDKVI